MANISIHARMLEDSKVSGKVERGTVGFNEIPYYVAEIEVGNETIALFLTPEQTEQLVGDLSDSFAKEQQKKDRELAAVI